MYSAPVTATGRSSGRRVDGGGLVCALGGQRAAPRRRRRTGLFDIRVVEAAGQARARRGAAAGAAGSEPDARRCAPVGEARTIRLRIYADRDYRGAVIRWQSKARAQVQRINAVVGAVFNVRFEVESLRDWDRSHVGVPLGSAFVEELEALDDGKQVDLVVGLVTPLHGVATSVHSIGYANYLSRHFMLRGMDDEQEFRAFEREFKLISARGARAALHGSQGAQGGRLLSARVGAHAGPDPPRGPEARS